jgi:hypothetical protein
MRLPSVKSVNVAVIHAEGGGDENGVVDLDIGSGFGAGGFDIGGGKCLPPFWTLAAMTNSAFSLGEISAVWKSAFTRLTRS